MNSTAGRVTSSSRAQSSSDQHVLNEAGRRRRLQATGERKAALPALLAVAGLLGALAWWRRRSGKANGRRPGKAPRSAVRQAKAAASEASNLPRNKAGNNKKNKDRKRAERERRAEKREKDGGRAGPSDPGHKEENDNTIVLTSKFVDATPKTVSNLPKAQRMGTPGGAGPSAERGAIDPAVHEALSRKTS